MFNTAAANCVTSCGAAQPTTGGSAHGGSPSREPRRIKAAVRFHQSAASVKGEEEITTAVASSSSSPPLRVSNATAEDAIDASAEDMVTVVRPGGVERVRLSREDSTSSDAVQEFIRYKELKYASVNRFHRMCTLLVVSLFVSVLCSALSLSSSQWYVTNRAGVFVNVGAFEVCTGVVSRSGCVRWNEPGAAATSSPLCSVPHLAAKYRTVWVFATVGLSCLGTAAVLALIAAFRPTRSKFHVSIVALSVLVVPSGIIVMSVFSATASCLRGVCRGPESNHCSEGFGWAMYAYAVGTGAALLAAGFASSMRSYVYLIRRQTRREMRAERLMRRLRHDESQNNDAEEEDDDDNGPDAADRSDTEGAMARGEGQRDNLATTTGESTALLCNPGENQSEASMGAEEPMEDVVCRAPACDGAEIPESNTAFSKKQRRRARDARDDPQMRSLRTPHSATPILAVPADDDNNNNNGGVIRIRSSGDSTPVQPTPTKLPTMYNTAACSPSRRVSDSALRVVAAAHERHVSQGSGGSNDNAVARRGGITTEHTATRRSRHHRRETSGGMMSGEWGGSSSVASTIVDTPPSATTTSFGRRPEEPLITAADMGITIEGASDWVYVESADMFYSFDREAFWDPINEEYYCQRRRLWVPRLEP